MNTREIIDRIFKDPSTRHSLTQFQDLARPIHDILSIYPKTAATGRDAGKTKYFLKESGALPHRQRRGPPFS